MANLYVRSTDGSDSDNGSTWALAKATLNGAAAIDAAGDTIYVSQVHAESTAAQVNVPLAGTGAAPTKLICGNDSAEPPTAVASTASVTSTGSNTINFTGACYYVTGLSFYCGTGANNLNMDVCSASTGSVCVIENCSLNMVATGATGRIDLVAGAGGSDATFKNCTFSFAASGQGFRAAGNGGLGKIQGGSLASGTSPATLVPQFSAGAAVDIRSFDLTNASSSINIFSTTAVTSRGKLINSKLPASWSGSLVSGAMTLGSRFEMHNCDSADTNYRLWIEDFTGSVKSETTIVRTGGASDGTTALSWKLTSGADAEYPRLTLDTPEIVVWNDTTGSAITVTVEIVTDNVTLTDGECWVEMMYLGTSGYPLGSFINDAKADVLASAANQSSSSETWTTTGLTTPVKQKLSVTFTPEEKGFIHAVVKLAKASTTVYACPKLDVT